MPGYTGKALFLVKKEAKKQPFGLIGGPQAPEIPENLRIFLFIGGFRPQTPVFPCFNVDLAEAKSVILD